MSLRMRYPLLAAVLGLSAVVLPTIANSEPLPVEAVNVGSGVYGTHYWSNSQQTIMAGEKVKFSNPYSELPYHGLKFTGPAPSGCSGIPAAASEATGAPSWHGECTFSTPGAYTFICTVHPSEMKGTIIVPGTPVATTEPPTEVTQTGVRLNGAVKPEGNATEYHFEYGTTTVSEHTTGTLSAGSADFGNHPVSAELTGLLLPGVKYRFQLVATYGASKTVVGGEQMFTTLSPSAPTVKIGAVTGLRETEATLNGTVDPNDGEATEYSFEYGTSPAYGQVTVTKSLPADNINHPVSATLTKLTPGTEYHFRLVAKNKLGPATGEDHTFKTVSSSSPPSEPSPPTTTTSTTSTAPIPPPTTTTPAEPSPGAPIAGSPSLRSAQHGSSVRGSLDVTQAGSGGRLEVDLLARSASLAAVRRSAPVRVGRLVRAPVSAGRVSFSVALTARGKNALRRHRRLVLTVKIALKPIHGTTASVTRSVTLRS
jgi:plastocyanin